MPPAEPPVIPVSVENVIESVCSTTATCTPACPQSPSGPDVSSAANYASACNPLRWTTRCTAPGTPCTPCEEEPSRLWALLAILVGAALGCTAIRNAADYCCQKPPPQKSRTRSPSPRPTPRRQTPVSKSPEKKEEEIQTETITPAKDEEEQSNVPTSQKRSTELASEWIDGLDMTLEKNVRNVDGRLIRSNRDLPSSDEEFRVKREGAKGPSANESDGPEEVREIGLFGPGAYTVASGDEDRPASDEDDVPKLSAIHRVKSFHGNLASAKDEDTEVETPPKPGDDAVEFYKRSSPTPLYSDTEEPAKKPKFDPSALTSTTPGSALSPRVLGSTDDGRDFPGFSSIDVSHRPSSPVTPIPFPSFEDALREAKRKKDKPKKFLKGEDHVHFEKPKPLPLKPIKICTPPQPPPCPPTSPPKTRPPSVQCAETSPAEVIRSEQKATSPRPVICLPRGTSPTAIQTVCRSASPIPFATCSKSASQTPVRTTPRGVSPKTLRTSPRGVSPFQILTEQRAVSPRPVSTRVECLSPLPVPTAPRAAIPCIAASTPRGVSPLKIDVSQKCTSAVIFQTRSRGVSPATREFVQRGTTPIQAQTTARASSPRPLPCIQPCPPQPCLQIQPCPPHPCLHVHPCPNPCDPCLAAKPCHQPCPSPFQQRSVSGSRIPSPCHSVDRHQLSRTGSRRSSQGQSAGRIISVLPSHIRQTADQRISVPSSSRESPVLPVQPISPPPSWSPRPESSFQLPPGAQPYCPSPPTPKPCPSPPKAEPCIPPKTDPCTPPKPSYCPSKRSSLRTSRDATPERRRSQVQFSPDIKPPSKDPKHPASSPRKSPPAVITGTPTPGEPLSRDSLVESPSSSSRQRPKRLDTSSPPSNKKQQKASEGSRSGTKSSSPLPSSSDKESQKVSPEGSRPGTKSSSNVPPSSVKESRKASPKGSRPVPKSSSSLPLSSDKGSEDVLVKDSQPDIKSSASASQGSSKTSEKVSPNSLKLDVTASFIPPSKQSQREFEKGPSKLRPLVASKTAVSRAVHLSPNRDIGKRSPSKMASPVRPSVEAEAAQEEAPQGKMSRKVTAVRQSAADGSNVWHSDPEPSETSSAPTSSSCADICPADPCMRFRKFERCDLNPCHLNTALLHPDPYYRADNYCQESCKDDTLHCQIHDQGTIWAEPDYPFKGCPTPLVPHYSRSRSPETERLIRLLTSLLLTLLLLYILFWLFPAFFAWLSDLFQCIWNTLYTLFSSLWYSMPDGPSDGSSEAAEADAAPGFCGKLFFET